MNKKSNRKNPLNDMDKFKLFQILSGIKEVREFESIERLVQYINSHDIEVSQRYLEGLKNRQPELFKQIKIRQNGRPTVISNLSNNVKELKQQYQELADRVKVLEEKIASFES